MDSLTLTIIGGVVVVVIGLFIEYGYFQKRKHRGVEEVSSREGESNQAWPDAINKAIESFSKVHPNARVVIKTMKVVRHSAFITVYVFSGATRIYTLTVDRSGDILEVKDQS